MLQMGLGVDLNMVRVITGEGNPTNVNQDNENTQSENNNYCTPEMITKYVERLRA